MGGAVFVFPLVFVFLLILVPVCMFGICLGYPTAVHQYTAHLSDGEGLGGGAVYLIVSAFAYVYVYVFVFVCLVYV